MGRVDRDRHALLHLLELHLQELRQQSFIRLPRQQLRAIADSYATLRKLRGDTEVSTSRLGAQGVGFDGHAGSQQDTKGIGMEDFVRYYSGLRTKPRGGARRALIFSCSFGFGHSSAAEALTAYLEKDGFQVETVDTTKDSRFPHGMLSKVFGIRDTDMWNKLTLRRKWFWLYDLYNGFFLSIFGKLMPRCIAPSCDNALKKALRALVLQSRPDLIVTVYHMELMPILEVAKDLGNLPVLHVATDMDTKMSEVFGVSGPAPCYPRFLLAVPFDVPKVYASIPPLDVERTFLSGYPAREAFLRPVEEARVAAHRNQLVPDGTKVVLVMSGGVGQDVPWPEILAEQGFAEPLHVLVVVGRDVAAAHRLTKALPKTMTFPGNRSVLQGTAENVTVELAKDPGQKAAKDSGKEAEYWVSADHLAILMDVADAIITKPGGGTSAEAAYRGVPAVFDATWGMLSYEALTVDIFEQQGRGVRFTAAEELPAMLRKAMSLGRSTRLVAEAHAEEVLATSEIFIAAANRLLGTGCRTCDLFPGDRTGLAIDG